MPTLTRRLVPVFLACLLLIPTAGVVAASDAPPLDDAWFAQAGRDLVYLANRKRTGLGLVALRADPTLMSIARDRADVMAGNDVMSHTEPDGRKVFDRLNDAGLAWSGAGEIIAWNNYPAEYTAAEAIRAWMVSPGHHAIMVSTGHNYVGFGASMSATGKKYFAGVYARLPDHTGAWAKLGAVTKAAVGSSRKRVTIRWSGGDIPLQVATAGLRHYQIQRRTPGGAWTNLRTTSRTRLSVIWTRGATYQIRVRALDRAGNWGAWRSRTVRV